MIDILHVRKVIAPYLPSSLMAKISDALGDGTPSPAEIMARLLSEALDELEELRKQVDMLRRHSPAGEDTGL